MSRTVQRLLEQLRDHPKAGRSVIVDIRTDHDSARINPVLDREPHPEDEQGTVAGPTAIPSTPFGLLTALRYPNSYTDNKLYVTDSHEV